MFIIFKKTLDSEDKFYLHVNKVNENRSTIVLFVYFLAGNTKMGRIVFPMEKIAIAMHDVLHSDVETCFILFWKTAIILKNKQK